MQDGTSGVALYQCNDRNVHYSATKHQVLMCATVASMKDSKNNDTSRGTSSILCACSANKALRSMNGALCVDCQDVQ